MFYLPAIKTGKNDEKPIARVYDKYLYKSDLEKMVPDNISPSDSAVLATDFIDKWIRKQLLVNKAEINLTEAEKNVDKQIENYRSSLLIFKYEQNLINQKLDTVVTQGEIEAYYNENGSNFLLNNIIVKALFIQVSSQAPDLQKIKRWYRSNEDEDVKNLEAYAYQYAKKYEYFNDDWVDIKEIINSLPVKIDNPDNLLKYRKNYEVNDSAFYYFVEFQGF
ncbi:MAG: peptidyl-prolyl cis-trans isomerase [Bacteroidales bacterium]|nr:peptidyl-prolyl cis-trans isomerase [Bacteroidales bacterium]